MATQDEINKVVDGLLYISRKEKEMQAVQENVKNQLQAIRDDIERKRAELRSL